MRNPKLGANPHAAHGRKVGPRHPAAPVRGRL